MSKEHWVFENENGSIAFLSGVVDIISDNLSMTCDFGNSLDADIFYVQNNDITLLNDSIRKRLHAYNKANIVEMPKEKIDSLNFQLNEIKTAVYDFLYKAILRYSPNYKLSEELKEFLEVLRWHLGEPLCIYTPTKNRNMKILENLYGMIIFEYFFIAYNDYFVFVILGTSE